MSYQRERDEFIQKATREGLDLNTITRLLRYATTLQRLQEAQCNGDWPYNGDRDRPSPQMVNVSQGLTSVDLRARWDKRYTVCPKCEASGVAISAMRISNSFSRIRDGWKVCPDCRTQELVNKLRHGTRVERTNPEEGVSFSIRYLFNPIFNGDPRSAVLRIETPNYPWSDDGSKGYGLYVPARPGRGN